ncbi:cytoskeleton protein RodZ [Duganella sp. CF517]|uniref:helix-turn-helix domain-containing protein n=1 Tax=Duganella sp. CF517 TaxID=1881038 RepID=UPI0008C1E69B|nr:helix-turn-helix domain-containing protein [Duganella sp. CF517]SEN29546.1 cytoskeleton protein RodZ [Duganella sp. CF517]
MNSEWAEAPKRDQGGTSLATPGAQLAAQREAMGMSVEQIADQLKLAPRQVVALEAGDYASLPNMAVVRGFVRAYAKVVKLDPTPLVAMIAVISPTSPEAAPPRTQRAAEFSESRFPLMTDRSSGRGGWIVGAVVVAAALIGGGVYAYQSGLISTSMFERAGGDAASSASAVTELPKPIDATMPLETTLVKPGQETAPLQSPNVPLISVPPPGTSTNPADAASAPAGTAAAAAATTTTAPAAATTTTAPATTSAPAAQVLPPAAAPAAASGTQLVLEVTSDSWVEIRRPGTKPLISRLVKAGSTETFDIKDPALLIVGKPDGVKATLGGAPLALPPVAGGTISRVNIK